MSTTTPHIHRDIHAEPKTPGEPSASAQSMVELARYGAYADAERVVDRLSDDGFDVSTLRIVANDLSLVEQIRGRVTTWTAALRGAGSGALFGFLLGALLGSFSFVDPLVTFWITGIYGLLIGAVLGGVFGAVGHAMLGGRRDFDSVQGIHADSYSVVVPSDRADEARRRLS